MPQPSIDVRAADYKSTEASIISLIESFRYNQGTFLELIAVKNIKIM